MMESPVGFPSEDMELRDSPPNKRTIKMSSEGTLGNDENLPNGVEIDDRTMKRAKTDSTPSKAEPREAVRST